MVPNSLRDMRKRHGETTTKKRNIEKKNEF